MTGAHTPPLFITNHIFRSRFARPLLLFAVGFLTCLFTPVFVLAPVSIVTTNVLPQMTEMTWDYILYSIEVAGPTFIKLSQWASTRSDLFPQEFCLRFAKLQDATRGHSWSDTDKTLKEAFGENWTDKIELDESRRPIGSGCIAQVYHGKLLKPSELKPAGEEIAVKVVHPHIKEKVRAEAKRQQRTDSSITNNLLLVASLLAPSRSRLRSRWTFTSSTRSPLSSRASPI